jgi:hypothetical protein
MLLDKQNLFSSDQALTATAVSTNVIDRQAGGFAFTTDTLGNTPPEDPGLSPELEVLCTVTEDFSGGTSVQVQVCADDAAALSSPTVLLSSAAIAVASLKKGYQFRIAIPPGMAAADRYIGLNYVVVGTPTLGKVTAGIVSRMGKQTAPSTFR